MHFIYVVCYLLTWMDCCQTDFFVFIMQWKIKVSLFIYILSAAPADFRSAEEDLFIEITSDFTLRLRFTAQTLGEFWFGVEREYPLIGQRAVCIHLPFATPYLCEMGFSAVASLKTKLAFLFSSAEKNERSISDPLWPNWWDPVSMTCIQDIQVLVQEKNCNMLGNHLNLPWSSVCVSLKWLTEGSAKSLSEWETKNVLHLQDVYTVCSVSSIPF